MRLQLARISSVLLLAGAFVVMNAARADATLIVYVCNDAACGAGGIDFTIADGSGLDSNPAPGAVTFFTPGGGAVSASSYPNQGSATDPFLNLTYNLNSTTFASFGGTPFLYSAQDPFTVSGLASLVANASNGSGTATLYSGPGSFLPLTGTTLASCVMPCSDSGAVTADYYLALGVVPVAASNGGANGDATATVVPQQTVPDGGSTAALLGSVLLGFGMLRRKFKN